MLTSTEVKSTSQDNTYSFSKSESKINSDKLGDSPKPLKNFLKINPLSKQTITKFPPKIDLRNRIQKKKTSHDIFENVKIPFFILIKMDFSYRQKTLLPTPILFLAILSMC